MSASLRLAGASKRFGGVQAVDDVTLEFVAGRTHGLIGPNGAGKTTLLSLISGSLTLSAGSIHYGDRNLSKASAHVRSAGIIARTFQVTSLFPALSVRENIALAVRSALGLNGSLRARNQRARVDERLEDVLARTGLRPVADRDVRDLSHGEQRMTEIGVGLALKPAFLLLDEPTAGMSRKETRIMVEQMGELRIANPDVGIVLVEHDMEVVLGLSDVLTVMQNGRTLMTGDPMVVRDDPRVVEAYLGREH